MNLVSMNNTRSRWQNKTIKKTVTLQAWTAQLASDEGINFSTFIQKALLRKLKHSVHTYAG